MKKRTKVENGTRARRKLLDMPPINNRSVVTNGKQLFIERFHKGSAWYRRYNDLLHLHLNDLGGEGNVSEAEHSLIRRAVTITSQLEYMESKFADINDRAEKGEDVSVSSKDLDLFQKLTNTLRRTLQTLGLHRRPRDITPPRPLEYARKRLIEASEDDND